MTANCGSKLVRNKTMRKRRERDRAKQKKEIKKVISRRKKGRKKKCKSLRDSKTLKQIEKNR